MKGTNWTWLRLAGWFLVCAVLLVLALSVNAQGVTTTTVQGTVYDASGAPSSGTLLLSWPAFTTNTNLAVAAGNTVVTIGADGFLSVNLTPNLGANPAGLYYTAVYHLADGTVNTEYWVVPAAASASIAQVRAQLMPAAQAVQTVSKAYVDEAIAELEGSLLTSSGGTLTGPLILAGDPTTPLMAADKHYVDEISAGGLSGGGVIAGPLLAESLNGIYAPEPGSAQSTLQATQIAAATAGGSMMVPGTYTGTDTFANAGGIRVEDLRASGAQQHERSVKEFGAVCDGVTDDTAALQAAINFTFAQSTAGHAIVLVLPAGTCKTQQLIWHGESIGGQGRQASALMGFPGQDVLASAPDATNLLANTRLHDFTIYVDGSVDVSCSQAEGRSAAGSCGVNRSVELGSVSSPGGNGLTGIAGSGAGWSIGNCAIAMPAATGAGGNGLRVADVENIGIAVSGIDPLAAYGAHSTHTCGMYLGQWPLASDFRNIDIRGVGTGIAVPALPVAAPAGLTADSNRWQNVTVLAAHGFLAGAGSNGVLDDVVLQAWSSAATGESATGLLLDFASAQSGWTVRNAVVNPEWIVVQPALVVHAASGAVTSVTVGPEHGLGFEAYGPTVPISFSGSCTAAANAAVNSDGSLGTVSVTGGGVGCSGTTTAVVNASGTAVAARPVNLIAGTNMTFVGGNLLKGVGGYTVWNAAGSRTIGTGLGGGGTLTASSATYPALVLGAGVSGIYSGSQNRFDGLGIAASSLSDAGLGNSFIQASATGFESVGLEAARAPSETVSADFALLGGGAANQAFASLNDLFFSAEDLYSPLGETVAAGSVFGKDSTAPVTASYVKAVGGGWDTSGAWVVRGAPGELLLGKGFPAGSGTWEIAAKADGATTQELKLSGTGASGCVFADQVVSLTTSWQVFRIAYNTVTGIVGCDSATQGNAVNAVGLSPSVATNVETAWMAFVPAFQELLIANAPTSANQAANKGYVDSSISAAIGSGGGSGSGALPITGGTLTGPLTAPMIDGTTDCALSSSVATCVSTASSALIPPGTVGSYTQSAAMQATAQCVYDPTLGGKITGVVPGQLGQGYTGAPLMTITGGGGSGLTVTANVSSGQVASYTVTNSGLGYTSCPTISVAAPPAAAAPIAVLDQRRGISSYSADVRVDDFGCAADGVTDDTQCFNDAISYVTQGGTQAGSITLTQGKTYFIGTITGYMQTAWDDGTAPSTDTCGGVACTNITPETPGYLGYAIRVQGGQTNPLTIYGNGATIVSSYTTAAATAATYTMAAPYFAVFGSDGTIGGWNVFDLNINKAFIAAATRQGAYWRWQRVNMNQVGIAVLAGSSQLSTFQDTFIQNAAAGIIVGGWWGTRAPGTSTSGGVFLNNENLGDSTAIDGMVFYGANWATTSQSQTVQNALDTWFNKYFFHVSDNQTRLTDQNQANLGPVTDSMWRGIYHVMFATYSRYGRPVLGVTVHNVNVKETQNYPIVANAAIGWEIDGLGTENVGFCNGQAANGNYGSTSCPSPYDSVNNVLPGAVLLYGFERIFAKNIGVSGSAMLEAFAEPQQISAAQQLSDFRLQLTNLESVADSPVAPRVQPVPTGRLILGSSNSSFPPGVTNSDSGELCMKGVNSGFADEWCMRAVEQAYPSGGTMPRYLTMENDGYIGYSGPTAVQMPGLRVRPGTISGGDATLPVTDFTEQAFAIAAGTVSGETCATVPGIAVAGGAVTDGVLFVRAPSSVGQLQLSGSFTALNTLSLTVCNPSTIAQAYPAGTYYAFLLAGGVAPSTPAVSGGAPVATNPLTTTQGDLVVGDVNGNPARLAGNSATTPAVLMETGNGSIAGEATWQSAPEFYGGNLTGLNASNIVTGSVGIGNGGTGATTALQALTNLGGASLNASVNDFAGELSAKEVGASWQVDQFSGSDVGVKIAACLAGLSTTYGGVCDARNFAGTVTMASTLNLNVPNATVLLPCATISTSAQIVVPVGARNVTLKGCGLRGASGASGSQGGTVLLYSGPAAALQVGDATYAADTMGFHLDDVVINTTGSTAATTQAVVAYRTQEMDLESLYLLGNSNQTGMTIDGTGNYAGGTFYDVAFNGWQTAVNGIGHQVANPATTDWMNASTFIRLHIDCPTSGGSPIAGTYGINLQQGDGNTFTGGDVEGCATALHLGANAQNNTIVGLRNENSSSQVVADAGSAYNSWVTGGTMFTGALTDNGSRNSFLDAFHRTFNGVKGDWYASQIDSTVTNHLRLGTGAGNVRGLLWESQVDVGTTGSQYNWLWGLTDGASGQSNWIIQDLINNSIRLQVQENNTAGNNSTAINGTGTGNVCFQCSGNAGTGGVAFSSGGSTPMTVATINGAGNAQFVGSLQVGGVTTLGASSTVKNQADSEIDSTLWAGLTAAQKESFVYKDWNGNSQWYMVKDAGNNWALNSAIDNTDHFKAYQSGETMLNSNGTGYVSVNREAGSGTGGFVLFSGGSSPVQVAKVDSSGDIANSGTLVSVGNVSVMNGANAEADVVVQPGSTADQNGAFVLNSFAGVAEWKLKKDASNYFRLSDVVNSLDRMVLFQNGETVLNAGAGANVVGINNTSGSGTGGLIVYGGGTNYATAELTVTGSGNVTATGFVDAKTLSGSGTMGFAAGAAAGTGATFACMASHVCDGVSGTATLTTGTSPATGTVGTITFPNTRTNQANCMVMIQMGGVGQVSSVGWNESTTAVTLTGNVALAASSAYSVRYWCGGN
jgi:hypothetical protein